MKVLVIGDAMTDVYWLGTVSRISPEAPVPVLSIQVTDRRPGGAANVAANIESLGVSVERIFSTSKRIEKIRAHTDSHHIARLDFDFPQDPIPCDQTYEEALQRCEIVVMVDYGKGALANVQELILAARAMNRTALVDPKGWDWTKYRQASLIKPNREEMRQLVGGWKDHEELDFKARQFLVSSGIESILLTQGSEGMTLYTKDTTIHEDITNPSPIDVSGAGEATLSAYAASLARGMDTKACIENASRAAGVAIANFGTYVLKESEVFG